MNNYKQKPPRRCLIIRKTVQIIVILSCLICIPFSFSWADTVYLKEGSPQKGLILEETQKSVIMSTVEGEKELFFNDITKLEYDEEEKNFFHLGLQFERQGNRIKAIGVYQKAVDINPEFIKAKDRMVYLRSLLRYEREHLSQKKVSQKEGALQRWNVEPLEKSLYNLSPEEKKTLVSKQLGIEIGQDGSFPVAKRVLRLTRPFQNTFEAGDRIVEIWGESARYEEVDAVVNKLIGPRFSQIKLVIERAVQIDRKGELFAKTPLKAMGLGLEYKNAGLQVVAVKEESLAEGAGILKHDFIVAVDSESTRYMPLTKVIRAMKGDQGTSLGITIQRTVWLMRGETK